jgi:hypothetical protein
VRAVVAGEEYQRIFRDPELADLREDGSNIARVSLPLRRSRDQAGSGLAGLRVIARKLHALAGLAGQVIVGMTRRIRQVTKNGPAVFLSIKVSARFVNRSVNRS